MLAHDRLQHLKVLLWSPSQQCFHGEILGEMILKNWDAYLYAENHDSDWIVVGIADTDQELADIRARLKTKMDLPSCE